MNIMSAKFGLFFLCSLTFVTTLPHIPGIPNLNTIINGLIAKKTMDFYTLRSNAEISAKCQAQSEIYFANLVKRQAWALRMFDASSKLQSGLYSLNIAELGSFDQCINIDSKDDDDIQGKYCLVKFIPHKKQLESFSLQSDAKTRATIIRSARTIMGHPFGANTRDSDDPEDPEEPDQPMNPMEFGVQWSICVPQGCSAKDVVAHLRTVLPGNNETLSINLKESSCQTRASQPKMRQGDWWFVAFLILILIGMVVCTTYDIYLNQTDQKTKHPLLLTFSWYTNGKKLLHVNKSPDQLPCLNGIRFISMMWVVLGHQYGVTAMYPVVNFKEAIHWIQDWPSLYIVGSTISVDTFFMLSGCLLMYGFMKSRVKKIPFNIPLFYLHRYLRLTPALVAVMIFHITLIRNVGSGPLYPAAIAQNTESCEKYWWSTLLYVQNYVNPNDMCVGQSWYLQVDMQLFWLSPLILWPCAKWPKYALYFLGGLILIFIGIPTYIAAYYKFDAAMINNKNPEYMPKYYVATQSRANTWLVGLALGFVLFQTKDRRIRLNWITVVLGWIIAGVVLVYVLFGTYPNIQKDYVYDPVYNSMFLGMHRPVWCLGVSWVIFACINGYGGPVNLFLSLPIFQILGRLTYSMYLTHLTMEVLRGGVARSAGHFSDLDVWFIFWGSFMFDMLIAVVWIMAFEAPMAVIDGMLLGLGKKSGTQTGPKAKAVLEVKPEENLKSSNVELP